MNDEKMAWFRQAKYGLFIHFGLYSSLAGKWKGQTTKAIAEWIMNTLDIPKEEYRALAASFDPKEFDADMIAKRAAGWGMKYIVFTSKHHEGFALFDSDCSDYTSVKASPCKRDFVAELEAACLKYGLKFGVYYSQAQDWDDDDGYMAHRDNPGKDYRAYLDRKSLPQVRELLAKYPGISLIWFDTPMGTTSAESREFVDLVRAVRPDVIISGRIGNGLGDYMTTGDNFIPAGPAGFDFEVPATLNDTWGYKACDNNWKSPDKILKLLLKIVSRGGNYLLNIGPDGSGRIPQRSLEILDEVGLYVNENEEAIFGCRSVPSYPYDLDWCIFTGKPYKFFIHVTENTRTAELLGFKADVKKAYVLSGKEDIPFHVQKTCEGDSILILDLPDKYKKRKWYCICLELENENAEFEEIRF